MTDRAIDTFLLFSQMCNMYSACAHLNCKYISKICNFVCCPNIFANTIHFELKYWACDVYSSKRRLKSIRICSHRMQTTSLWLHTDITQQIQILSSKGMISFFRIVPSFFLLLISLQGVWCTHWMLTAPLRLGAHITETNNALGLILRGQYMRGKLR